MSHIIPVIIAVLIANGIAQSLELSIYDSIIQIKKLPFLPPILSTSSAAHNVFVEDIMVRDVAFIWRNCTYRDLRNLLKSHRNLHSFPFVESPETMILLGSVQRHQLAHMAQNRLGRERRLQEVRRRYSIQDTLKQAAERAAAVRENQDNDVKPGENFNTGRRMSRFEVTPVQQQQPDTDKASSSSQRNPSPPPSPNRLSPKSPVKSILKQTVSITYSPNSTITLAAQGKLLIENSKYNYFKKISY